MKYLPVVTGPDNMLQAQKTNNKTSQSLSILIHQDGLSFYIYDSNDIIDKWYETFESSKNPEEILEAIKEQESKKIQFPKSINQITLFYHHNLYTLIPNSIFKEEHASDYLKYNAHLLKTDVLSNDKINSQNLVITYIAYQNINNYFFEKYGDFTYLHYSSSLLRQEYTDDIHDVNLLIDLFNNDFYLSVFKRGVVIAHNLFPHQTEEDILYYVMFAIEQYGLDPTDLLLILRGNNIPDSLKSLLELYIYNVKIETEYSRYQEQLLCV